MIRFETVTTIDDTEFDTLFNASLSVLDEGAYAWHLFPEVDTVEQKKIHIRAAYDRLLTEGFVWRVYDDDGVLLLNAGTQTGNRATFLLGLVKPNAAGTKSYLYTDDFNNDIKNFEVIYLLIKLYNQHSLIIKMSKLRSGMLA